MHDHSMLAYVHDVCSIGQHNSSKAFRQDLEKHEHKISLFPHFDDLKNTKRKVNAKFIIIAFPDQCKIFSMACYNSVQLFV
jgi:hypothetical protein